MPEETQQVKTETGGVSPELVIGGLLLVVVVVGIIVAVKSGKSGATPPAADADKVVTLMSVADAKAAFGAASKDMAAATKAAKAAATGA